jgi:2'-5' RNA ligase
MYNNDSTSKECVWIGVGIDIKPEDSYYPEIVKLSEILKQQYGSNYEFSTSNPPHINLYDIDIPKTNLEKASRSLERIAEKWKHFSVKLASIDFFKHRAVYIQCELSNPLRQLEKEIVEALADYREGCRTEDYWQPWREYNQPQINNRNKYGNPHVLDTFTPHITLGCVKTKLSQAVQETKRFFVPTELSVKQIDMVIQNSNGEFIAREHFKFA